VIDSDARAYVEAVLALYRRLPDTATRPRPDDRLLAHDWCRRGIPLDLIALALALANARRHDRPPDSPPLPPVRSLHYYRPVVDELLNAPARDLYLRYLRNRLETLNDAHSDRPPAPHPEPASPLPPKAVQPRLPLATGAPSKNDVS
jgi:hypothetical protein